MHLYPYGCMPANDDVSKHLRRRGRQPAIKEAVGLRGEWRMDSSDYAPSCGLYDV